jgi:hypothetical protein
MKTNAIMKRGYCYGEAVDYLGVTRKFFDTEIRPNVTWTRAGVRMIADRIDLDRAWDEYRERRKAAEEEGNECRSEPLASSRRIRARGKSISGTEGSVFELVSGRILAKLKAGS